MKIMQKFIQNLLKRRTRFYIIFFIVIYIQGNNGNAFNFYSMLSTKMQRNPLDFNNYGRYCGLWGTGKTLDLLDKCCLEHDECYKSIADEECYAYGSLAPLWIHYNWKILKNNTIICADSKSNYFGLCASKTCECDVKVCDCFLNYQYVFNIQNRKTLMWRAFEEYFLRWLFPTPENDITINPF